MTQARLLGPQEIHALAAELGLTPTKRLGQNFVTDPNTVRRIVRAAGVVEGSTVLEIGPGLGSLTLALLAAGAHVIAVEIDGRLAGRLPQTVRDRMPEAASRLEVLHRDALSLTGLARQPQRLVANLPYNVSVPVLLHTLAQSASLESGVVMVQAEVGERLAASPGSKAYGAPSVKASWYGAWRVVGAVSRQVFWPLPNVDSVLIGFQRATPPGPQALRERVFALVDAAFGQRRKMLRRALATIYGSTEAATRALTLAGIDPAWRGERLTVADFARLAGAADPGADPGRRTDPGARTVSTRPPQKEVRDAESS
jgi:16S rRNA (adenine1518-N6/adenine1519-N6)-dimethyltransferase